MLFERRTRRQLIVGREAFPLDRRVRVAEQRLRQRPVNALAIGAVGHDQDSGARLIKIDGVVTPAFVVAFPEERATVGREVQSPAQAVAELDAAVGIGGFGVERGEFVLLEDLDLRREHLLTRLRVGIAAFEDRLQKFA